MSYTVKIYWKNCPKWDSNNMNFMDHLLYNVSRDPEITVSHISQMALLPAISITQEPSPDLDTGWITLIECADSVAVESFRDFYTNTIIPTLVENREIIIEVINNGN
jgi:hypothetical protein